MSYVPAHFYVVFNPLFNEDSNFKTQAHEFYYALQDRVKANPKGYMYWGKLQVSNHADALNHHQYQQVVLANNNNRTESHIFITDYQFMWVGKVEEVLKTIPDPENALPFYKNRPVEMWFKISDFDLISQDPTETALYLKYLYVENKFKEINPYLSGLRFPMIVQDSMEQSFFRHTDAENLNNSHRILQPNLHIEKPGESVHLTKTIQSYVIPEKNFRRLPEIVRSLVVSAEVLLSEATQKGRPDRMKLELVVSNYLRSLEVMLNETFIRHLKEQEGHKIFVKKGATAELLKMHIEADKTMPLTNFQDSIGLGQMLNVIGQNNYFNHTTLDHIFRSKKKFWDYCRTELKKHFQDYDLKNIRNLLAHGQKVELTDEALIEIRNLILGVGCAGILNEMVSAYNIERANLSEVKKVA